MSDEVGRTQKMMLKTMTREVQCITSARFIATIQPHRSVEFGEQSRSEYGWLFPKIFAAAMVHGAVI